jgi:hypothetical protein
MPPGTESAVYLSNDAFEKVAAFYKDLGKEYVMPGMLKGRKLPSGQELKQTYFIFDRAKDLGASKNWAQVQRAPLSAHLGPIWNPETFEM